MEQKKKQHISGCPEKAMPAKPERHLFDNPRNVKMLLAVFFSLIVLMFVLDFFVHKHGYFPWENWPAFYAVFGFVACVLLVLVSRFVLRPAVKRKEDYYYEQKK